MTIEPITKRVWCDNADDFVDTYELSHFEVRANDGTLLGTGESRDEALRAAREYIVLPTRRLTPTV
jgi:hypothetical protein